MKIKLIGPKILRTYISKFSLNALQYSDDDYDILLWHKGSVNTILDQSIILFNSDENRFLHDAKAYLISYGHNSKATVTISSIEDGQIMICLQRAIEDINGNMIEPQEVLVNYKETDTNSTEILACCTFALVSGIPVSKIQEIVF